jgi:hypothetical protein
VLATIDVLEELLHHFSPLFAKPTGLPPDRHCSHHIRWLSGTPTIVVWPYRYTYHPKQEIDRQCATMLDQGVIHPSSSTFIVPVLLMKKANGS